MKKTEIRNRWTGSVMYTTETEDSDANPLCTAVQRAVFSGVDPELLRRIVRDAEEVLADEDADDYDLAAARLHKEGAERELATPSVNARLDGASLDGARLDGASLVNARLVDARLDGASLVNARLDGASLDGASLVNARLDGASLVGASLVNARLVGARLDGASLDGASLDGARLDGIRDDFRSVLDAAPDEVGGLLAAVRDGRIDGSHYEGECACLVGTIAKVRGKNYKHLGSLKPDSTRPSEIWFLALRPGHTPANNPVSAIVEKWIVEWQAERPAP